MKVLKEGDLVEIIDGPYQGQTGTIHEIISFEPEMVGLYIIKLKDGSLVKIIETAILRLVEENEPEPEREDTITISRSDLKNAIDNVTRAELYEDKFSNPEMIDIMILTGMFIGAKIERELFND